jgi:hypothetical protein
MMAFPISLGQVMDVVQPYLTDEDKIDDSESAYYRDGSKLWATTSPAGGGNMAPLGQLWATVFGTPGLQSSCASRWACRMGLTSGTNMTEMDIGQSRDHMYDRVGELCLVVRTYHDRHLLSHGLENGQGRSTSLI